MVQLGSVCLSVCVCNRESTHLNLRPAGQSQSFFIRSIIVMRESCIMLFDRFDQNSVVHCDKYLPLDNNGETDDSILNPFYSSR